jgi:hypothetical protein
VKLVAGKTYVIDLVSPDPKALDPSLVLSDAAGQQLAEDDDGGGGRNARIVFRAEQDGTYRLRATSCNAGRGAFTLTVRERPPPTGKEKDRGPPEAVRRSGSHTKRIAVGRGWRGTDLVVERASWGCGAQCPQKTWNVPVFPFPPLPGGPKGEILYLRLF